MTGDDANAKQDMIRCGISLALGMLVVLWRVVMSTTVEITIGAVILVAALDLLLTGILVFINKNELKEIFAKKYDKNVLSLNIIWCSAFYIGATILNLVIRLAYGAITGVKEIPDAPAAWVADQFQLIFPPGIFISTVIAAPIWEEIAFRMAGKRLFKNSVLFILVSSLLFAFIHTANFSFIDNSMYFIMGVSFCAMYLKTKDLKMIMIVLP